MRPPFLLCLLLLSCTSAFFFFVPLGRLSPSTTFLSSLCLPSLKLLPWRTRLRASSSSSPSLYLSSEAAEVVQRLLEEGKSLRDSRESLRQRLASSVDTVKSKQATISTLGMFNRIRRARKENKQGESKKDTQTRKEKGEDDDEEEVYIHTSLSRETEEGTLLPLIYSSECTYTPTVTRALSSRRRLPLWPSADVGLPSRVPVHRNMHKTSLHSYVCLAISSVHTEGRCKH